MSPAWPISADAEAWTSNIQGVEVPWPLDPAQKDTQQRNQESEDTNRCHRNKEEEADSQGTGGQITRHYPLGTLRGMGRRLRLKGGGGGGVMAMEEGRGMEGPLEGKTPRV